MATFITLLYKDCYILCLTKNIVQSEAVQQLLRCREKAERLFHYSHVVAATCNEQRISDRLVQGCETSENGKPRIRINQAALATARHTRTSWSRACSRKRICWTCSKTLSSMRLSEDGQLRKSAAANSSSPS
jgi:hypothetical protein